MQAFKNLFSKKDTSKNPQIQTTFDHSKISSTDDASQCPFMKNKNQNKMTEEPSKQNQTKCPYKGKTDKKNKKDNDKQVESSSDQQQIPRGGCPFMGGSQKKRNPDLLQTNSAFNQPFVSKFHYYLSSNKIDFSALKRSKNQRPITKSRQIFNTYPIYLQHTLFYNGQDYKKVRALECCSRFLPYQKLREKGNKFFNKGKYMQALDYYQRALSLFKWLEYFQEDTTQKSLSRIPSQQSIQSSENLSVNNESKVHINLKNSEQQNEEFLDKDQQFDEMRTKYKQFFVVYTDGNVKLCDGQEMQEAPDIDMRKSLMLQVLLNMTAVYCHLNHYALALRCIEDCFGLSDKVSQIYLRKAQALIFNKGHSLQDAYEAKKCMQKALQLKSTQKIFQSNENILKMVNLHNAGQAFQKTLDFINQQIQSKQKDVNQIKDRIYNRAKQINQVQERLISQGKKPYQRNEEPMIQSKQYKILMRMKQKYVKVIEFYTEAQNKQQVTLAKRQIQQLIRVFSDMNTILNIQLEQKQNQLGGINTEKIQKRIQTIKKSYCQDIYNAGKFNFTVMEWAIKQIVKEQKQQEDMKKKAQEQQRMKNGQSGQVIQKQQKNGFYKKMSWGLVLIPIAGILINNFLLI